MKDILFSKIEFTKGGEILLIVKNTTLPDALEQTKDLKSISNFKINIGCYY